MTAPAPVQPRAATARGVAVKYGLRAAIVVSVFDDGTFSVVAAGNAPVDHARAGAAGARLHDMIAKGLLPLDGFQPDPPAL